MELDFAVLADHGTTRLDGKFDITGAGFDTILAAEAPVQHPRFVLAVRFLLTREEAATVHDFSVVLRTPDDDELTRASGQIPVLPEEYMAQLPPDADASVGAVLPFENIVFPVLGSYALSLEWHGEPIHSQVIRVAELPRPA